VRRVAAAAARLGRLAEATHPVARAVRDRVLLPAADLLTTARTTAAVLQEPSHVLRARGDPGSHARRAPRTPRPRPAAVC
jgi:hypothetical protein